MYSQINGIYFSHTGILCTPSPLLPESPTTNDTSTTNREASLSSSSSDGLIDGSSNDNDNLFSDLSLSVGRYKKDYDVFLSFSGQTRHTFTGPLYTALTNDGFSTYIDEEGLEKGEAIRPALMEAIEGSKISIVVFSSKYADSTWCLDELVKIMNCRRIHSTVLPIFYGVRPSDVRAQTGPLAEAFRNHEARFLSDADKVQRWRLALRDGANLSGWDGISWR